MGRQRMGLTTRVFAGMVLGVVFGLVAPGAVDAVNIVGELFLNAIQMVVVLLILFCVTLGVAELGDTRAVGKVGVAILLFASVTNLLSTLAGIFAGLVTNPAAGVTLPEPARVAAPIAPSWKEIALSIVPANLIDALIKANVLGVMFFSILLGVALVMIGKKAQPVLELLRSGSEAIIAMVGMIIRFAPYAVFTLTAYTVAKFGSLVLTAMVKLLLVIWVGTFLFVVAYAVVVNLLVLRRNPVTFFKSLGAASMMALATCSSMATMPVNVENTTRLGVPRETATMVIAAGMTMINGGSSFYKAIGVVFVATLYGVRLSGTQLLVVAALSAFLITAGVPAAGTLAISVALTALGIPIQGIALLMAIDRLRDMASTWGNVVIHSLGACTIHLVTSGSKMGRAHISNIQDLG
jgi:Na+/H+-dicarboxylate symporter